jgi:hypothetical protein
MSSQGDIISFCRNLPKSFLEAVQYRLPTFFVCLKLFTPKVNVGIHHRKRRVGRHCAGNNTIKLEYGPLGVQVEVPSSFSRE